MPTIFLLLLSLKSITAIQAAHAHDEMENKQQGIEEKTIMDRLNVKQKLILNQIVAFYVLGDGNMKNELCRNHSKRLKSGLRKFEPWALKMFDASSKLQSGILNGNLMEFGSFKQCINVYENNNGDPIKGQQCTLNIKPSMEIMRRVLEFRNISRKRFARLKRAIEGTILRWDVCVPDSCKPADVLPHFKRRILELTEGVDVNITISDSDCYGLKDQKPFSKSDWIVISIFTALTLLTIFCTFMDVFNARKEQIKQERNKQQPVHNQPNNFANNQPNNFANNQPNNLIKIFSIPRNLSHIFSNKRETPGENVHLECLHGIRALSIAYVVVGHRFLMTLFYPTVNGLELTEWLLEYPSTLILGGTVCVDTFFVLSGLLVSFNICEHLSKGKRFSYLGYYLYRYLRITPSYACVILIYCTVLGHFGSGPLWRKTAENLQKPCQYFWWTALLYIQNYTNPAYLCVLQSWYLTCDMQFYLFAPLLVYPLYKHPKLGAFLYAITYILSVLVSFAISWIYKFEANLLVSTTFVQSKYFELLYIAPYSRASTYIIGLGLGYGIFKTKTKKIKLPLPFLLGGWACSFSLMAAIVFYNHVFQLEDYDYNRIEASLYLSCSRSVWVLTISWIISTCVLGYGGPVDYFLSMHFFRVIGRLAYSIFLVHMLFQYLVNGSLKLPVYFSNFDLTTKFIGDFCMSALIGLLFTLLVEAPVLRAAKIFTEKN